MALGPLNENSLFEPISSFDLTAWELLQDELRDCGFFLILIIYFA